MSLQERLQSDLKDAMRAGDVVRRETLRMCLAALKNRRIELGLDLEESEELAVLSKQLKTRQETAEQAAAAGREDRAGKERAEAEVVAAYLPRMLSEEETRAVVEGAARELGATSKQDLGRVMKAVMAAHRGQVDGKLVQRVAAEILG